MSKPAIFSIDGPYKDGGTYVLKTDRGIMFIDNRFGSERKGPRGGLVWGVKCAADDGYHGYDMGRSLTDAESAIYQPLIDRYVKRLSGRRVRAGFPSVVISTCWR